MDELPSPEELNRIEDLVVAEARVTFGEYSYEPEGYKKLRVYQASMDLLVECYRVSAQFPKSETYGLVQQVRRAAVSIPLNIGEGWGRNTKPELARFSDISRGSAHELDAALEVAVRLQFVSSDAVGPAVKLLNRSSSMLYRLAQALRK